ncbi:hypothetical protein O6H91_05G093800 [Diphasiastrum complanatum]|uniref:Uncharacterized protein n=1 Tax=Diphasiastrum complanatum TaxID=34168 RepID=A0ACC2DR59_DIPCM|nr:hypothetical protein O6H91_05G093800 [Diphasiastrum complanatum]
MDASPFSCYGASQPFPAATSSALLPPNPSQQRLSEVDFLRPVVDGSAFQPAFPEMMQLGHPQSLFQRQMVLPPPMLPSHHPHRPLPPPPPQQQQQGNWPHGVGVECPEAQAPVYAADGSAAEVLPGMEDFKCNICFSVAQAAVVTFCGHLFCWGCLYPWLHIHSSNNECPVCRGGIPENSIVPIYGRGNASEATSAAGGGSEAPGVESLPPRPRAPRIESLRQIQDTGSSSREVAAANTATRGEEAVQLQEDAAIRRERAEQEQREENHFSPVAERFNAFNNAATIYPSEHIGARINMDLRVLEQQQQPQIHNFFRPWSNAVDSAAAASSGQMLDPRDILTISWLVMNPMQAASWVASMRAIVFNLEAFFGSLEYQQHRGWDILYNKFSAGIPNHHEGIINHSTVHPIQAVEWLSSMRARLMNAEQILANLEHLHQQALASHHPSHPGHYPRAPVPPTYDGSSYMPVNLPQENVVPYRWF